MTFKYFLSNCLNLLSVMNRQMCVVLWIEPRPPTWKASILQIQLRILPQDCFASYKEALETLDGHSAEFLFRMDLTITQKKRHP